MNGRRLSHYELIEEISRGGMGVVYRAVDLNLGREVAIKVLPDAILHDPERRNRLLHEARAASTLEHPHIAVIHEVGDDNGVTFIAMELIRGEKLSDVVRRAPLPLGRALTLAIEIAEGLGRAHDKGIVHRDLKPGNVMLTDEGHAKVIDFGLAKVIEPIDSAAATISVTGPRTESGVVLGTAAYMSPEQARGGRVDHRSDIFALGVTLYEMLTGRPAFQGASSLDTMHAILSQPVPPLPATDASAEVTAEVQRIINKCTAKDPDDRFQGMKDLVVDLRATRRHLDSAPSIAVTSVPSPAAATIPTARRRFRPAAIAVTLVAVAAIAVAVLWWKDSRPSSRGPSGTRAVAVLYFENNTGDQTLDWMRTGLTDMLVTDLSQSSDIEVVGTDRVVQILQEMKRADDRVLSADVVQAVADRAHVDRVVLGSYIKSGDTIRISARLQDARTGRIVKAERVEGPGQSAVFQLVDELTRRLKATISPPSTSAPGSFLARPGTATEERGLDRGVTEITTSSIDAYRYYAEGMNFHERSLFVQAMPLFEKAIEIDPEFAMALAKLAVVNSNLRRPNKAEEYGKRALAHVDRLTPRERYYIEGFYYGLRAETRARSIEAYKQELALHPEHEASRHNLGLHYLELEQYNDGIAQYDELLRRGTSNPTSYENLTAMLIATGNISRAREVADAFVRQQPDSATGYRNEAAVYMAEGHLDEARAAFEKSQALDPLDFQPLIGKRIVAMLRERWGDADAVTEELTLSPGDFRQFVGLAGGGLVAAARGRGQTALGLWDRAGRLPGLPHAQGAVVRMRAAALLLRDTKPVAALAQAEKAVADARGLDQEFEALRLLCVSQAAAGHSAAAQQALARLEARASTVPGEREVRRIHWARGGIALGEGNAAAATAELSKAVEMLPAHSILPGPVQVHADLWFDTALAEIQATHEAEAAKLLERLQSAPERFASMDAYARSFFLLGRIYERRGDATRAREQYAHFLDLWRDGDMERGWIAEAQRKVAGRN